MSEVIIPVEPKPQTLVVPHPPQEYLSIPDPSDGVITETPADSVFVFSQNADDEDVLLGVVDYEGYLMSEIVVGSGGGGGGLPPGWESPEPETLALSIVEEPSARKYVSMSAAKGDHANFGFMAGNLVTSETYSDVTVTDTGLTSTRADSAGSETAIVSSTYGVGGYKYDAETEEFNGALLTPSGITQYKGGVNDGVREFLLPEIQSGTIETLATVNALERGDITIPWSAIESPVGPTFRGPWREYGEVVAFVDFVDGVVPSSLVVLDKVPTGTPTVTVTQSLMAIDQTTTNNRPNLPGAQVPVMAWGNSTVPHELRFDMVQLMIPETITVTRVDMNSVWQVKNTGAPKVDVVQDGLVIQEFLPTTGSVGWGTQTLSAGLDRTSTISLRMRGNSPASNGAGTIGFTGFKVYGTRVTAYSIGDSVSYNGYLWQSIANINNDKPGETDRWIQVSPLGS